MRSRSVFVQFDFLDQSDDLPGKDLRQQGIGETLKWDVAEGKPKDSQIADEVNTFNGCFQHMG